mmetsp:Transcript_28173/g.73055  ORF Transcript_28173/g.73055 Transcript_28173/m.73055 type:complete len:241 (-) Transcript_28173:107-829(-)
MMPSSADSAVSTYWRALMRSSRLLSPWACCLASLASASTASRAAVVRASISSSRSMSLMEMFRFCPSSEAPSAALSSSAKPDTMESSGEPRSRSRQSRWLYAASAPTKGSAAASSSARTAIICGLARGSRPASCDSEAVSCFSAALARRVAPSAASSDIPSMPSPRVRAWAAPAGTTATAAAASAPLKSRRFPQLSAATGSCSPASCAVAVSLTAGNMPRATAPQRKRGIRVRLRIGGGS